MDAERLAQLLEADRPDEAARLISRYTVPQVTALTEDRVGHDLAPDTLEMAAGTFLPAGERVMIDVDAAYAFLGSARAALLLLVGQPEEPGALLYDSGGAPVPGAQWYSVGSVNGESAWAHTTHRRIVLDVDPHRPVTWQLVGGIIGAAATVTIPQASRLVITPDGTTAFVTSPEEGTVTPIVLGRPGHTLDSELTVQDRRLAPVTIGGSPQRLAADDAHVVVCHPQEGHVTVLSVADRTVVGQFPVPGGAPTECALTPDGSAAIIGTGAGHVARLELATGRMTGAEAGARIIGVAIAPDGATAYVADAPGAVVHRVALPELTIQATIPVAASPVVARTAPDGRVWVLCDPPDGGGRLQGISPEGNDVIADYELPYPRPSDLALVPTQGQSSDIVRTAWTVFDGGRYCQFLIGGRFEGEPHSFHQGTLGRDGDRPSAIALNDFGEIWVTQPDLDRVWKWPGGRLICRADAGRPFAGVFFGEYCEVSVYGAE